MKTHGHVGHSDSTNILGFVACFVEEHAVQRGIPVPCARLASILQGGSDDEGEEGARGRVRVGER
jgi:hypothetical protein